MTLLVAVIRAKQNETDYFLNPDFNNCQRKLLNLLLCNTDCCRNFLSLVPSRTDVFGGKAAVDLKSIPDRRSSPSRAAVTRAARRPRREEVLLPPWTWSGVWFIFTNRSSTPRADEDEVGGAFFHPERSEELPSISTRMRLIRTPGHAFLHTAHPRKPAWN